MTVYFLQHTAFHPWCLSPTPCLEYPHSAHLPLQPLHPPPPSIPFLPPQRSLTTLISHNPQALNIPPTLFPSIPPSLPHQTHNRLFFRPPLLDCHVREICSAVAFAVMLEGDADTVGAEIPVHGVGGGFEVHEEGDGVGEGGEFGEGDGSEAGVVKGTEKKID